MGQNTDDEFIAPPEVDIPPSEPTPKKRGGSYLGDVVKLVSGTSIAQVVGVLVVPVLARIFSPADFGVNALFNSLLGVITVIACLRYEMTIVIAKDESDSVNMLAVSSLFSLISGLFTVPIVLLWAKPIAMLFKSPELAPWLWMLPPSIFLMGLFTALNNWNTRTRHFGRLAGAKLTNTIVSVLSQLGLGMAKMVNAGGLIGGSLVGTIASTGSLAAAIWRDDHKVFKEHTRLARMLDGIKRYKKFPLISSWSALLNNISWQLPSFLLTPYFGSEVNGFYSMGNRVLRMPMSLIGAAISQAFFPRASVARHEGNLPEVVASTFRRLVVFSLFPMLTLSFIAKDLFVIVLGAQWAEAGVYTQILSLWTFFWFVSSPMSTLWSILNYQERGLRINLIIFLSRLASLLGGAYFNNARLAIILFTISGIIAYGYMSVAIIRQVGVTWNDVFSIIWKSFKLFIPLGVILVLLSVCNVTGWVNATTGTFGMLIYFIYIGVTDLEIRQFLRKIKPLKKVIEYFDRKP